MKRLRESFVITRDPRKLKALREHTRQTLRGWGLESRVVEAAVTAAHELVINALIHAQAPATLQLILNNCLRIEVSDTGIQEPRPMAAEPGQLEHGFGLAIVANLADQWGCAPTPTGKTVWCQLTV